MNKKIFLHYLKTSMINTALTLLLLLLAINGLNYFGMRMEAEEKMQQLLGKEKETAETGEEYFSAESNAYEDGKKYNWFGNFNEIKDCNIYFIVTLNTENEEACIDATTSATQNEDELIGYVRELWRNDKKKGGEYGYLYLSDFDGEKAEVTYVLLDMSVTYRDYLYYLRNSFLVGFVCYLLLIIPLYYVAQSENRINLKTMEKQQRFVADAGHELKTPLAIINADLDVLEIEHGKEEWLDSIRNQTKRLYGLTESMILLARMDIASSDKYMDQEAMEWETVDLTNVVNECIADLNPLAVSSGHPIQAFIAPGIKVQGNKRMMYHLCSCLLDNGIKYAEEGQKIRITLKTAGDNVILQSKNRAQQLEIKGYDELFERFYRRDQSRNSEKGGYGIGLSVAKEIVETHGGTIHAYSNDAENLNIDVTLKIAEKKKQA